MCEAIGLSQRRTYRLAGLSLSTCRYSAQRPGLVTRSYLYTPLQWHLNAGALVTGVSDSIYGVKVFALITRGFIAYITLTA